MFDRIAGVYDLMNSVMTAGLHHRWRRRAADLARVGPGDACSTSRPAPATWRSSWPGASGPAARSSARDFSEEMLEPRAREKAPEPRVRVGQRAGAALRRRRFDAATVGFGARNFSDLERGLAEMARVVRPGGRVVVLEITTPRKPPLSTFFRVLVRPVVPLIGRLAGDAEAYEYLPNSVKRFPGPEGLAAAMEPRRAERDPLDPHRGRDHRAARAGASADGT